MSAEQPAFIFADLVGYTAFTERNGDEAAADLALQFCARVCELNAGHGAAAVKSLGDGSLIHVPDPGCAVELGLEIVATVGPSHGLPRVRVGIDCGSAARRGDDWFGTPVNRAARLSQLADEASVLVTDAVRQVDSRHGTIDFRSVGRPELKGLSERVELFEAIAPVSSTPRDAHGAAAQGGMRDG